MAKKATARPVPEVAPIVVVPPSKRHDYEILRKQVPQTVYNNLAGALTGDIEAQAKMFWAMVDSWPRLSSNLRDMQDAVASTFRVKAFTAAADTAPTPEAIAKAKFVEDAVFKMRGSMERNEVGFPGLVKDIVYGYYASPYVAEMYWTQDELGMYPYGAKAVPPNYYGYPRMSDNVPSDRLLLFKEGLGIDGVAFPDHKFIIATNQSHPGHPALSSPMRVMTSYWMAATYGLEWLMQYAQLFGVPFRWAEVSNPNDMAAVNTMLQNMGGSGHGAFPPNTKINFEQNPGAGSTLPQSVLRDLADKQCDIWVRGETLTSDEGSSGSRSLGEVHERVYLKRKQSVSRYAARVVSEQYVKDLMELNFGDIEEMPIVEFAIPDPAGDMARIDRMGKIIKMGIDVTKERVYEEIGEDQPEDGEELFESNIPDPVAPAIGGVPGKPPSGKVTDKMPRPADKSANNQLAAMRAEKKIDTLVDNTLRGLTGLQPQWLGGVRPFFERLIAKAEDGSVTEEDFQAALTQASRQLPDQFDRFDTAALARALESANMTAITLGAQDRLEDFDAN
jgi:phage gp29-like protein